MEYEIHFRYPGWYGWKKEGNTIHYFCACYGSPDNFAYGKNWCDFLELNEPTYIESEDEAYSFLSQEIYSGKHLK
jgi:hypothetical protein